MERPAGQDPTPPLRWFGFEWFMFGRLHVTDIRADREEVAWLLIEARWMDRFQALPDWWQLEGRPETRKTWSQRGV